MNSGAVKRLRICLRAARLIVCVGFAGLAGSRAAAQSPSLTIDRSAGPARIGIQGEPGAAYTLENSTNLASGPWDFLLTLPLTNSLQTWFDSASVLAPRRFYRARRLEALPVEYANDFRLIDHLGRSRSLYYHYDDPNVRAVVLVFTGNGCAKIRDMIPVIKSLTSQFASQGVLFWLVDSNPQDNRSNILAEAVSLGISNGPPILHDAAQLVGHTYHASTMPEAVGINMTDFSVFYRGAMDDRLGSNAVATTQSYLSNALVNFLAGGVVSPTATRPAGCAIPFSPRFANLLYSTDIAPLLADKCVRCHSPGNLAPWAMTNYDIVFLHAGPIRQEVMTGRMPPWKADPHYGVFTNDYSLTPTEARRLIQWIDDGAVKGPAEPDPLANLAAPTNYPFAWPAELGPPDAVLRIPAQSIPASGIVGYRYLNVANTAFSSNVWLRAAVVRPTNTRVVHHCLVFDGSTSGTGLDGFFAGYVPGADATALPPDTGKLLTAGQTLQFQMHYITVGTAQTEQTELGLYLRPSPPPYPLQTKSAFNVFFAIPGNSATYQTTASFPSGGTLSTNILLYEVDPHMHLRGSWFKYEAIYPAGHSPASEVLLSVPSYVFHWQTAYRFAQPKYIPKGSKIICTAAWDNTGQNTELMEAYYAGGDSRFLPSRTVTFGEQTYDEMFIGYLNYAEVP